MDEPIEAGAVSPILKTTMNGVDLRRHVAKTVRLDTVTIFEILRRGFLLHQLSNSLEAGIVWRRQSPVAAEVPVRPRVRAPGVSNNIITAVESYRRHKLILGVELVEYTPCYCIQTLLSALIERKISVDVERGFAKFFLRLFRYPFFSFLVVVANRICHRGHYNF